MNISATLVLQSAELTGRLHLFLLNWHARSQLKDANCKQCMSNLHVAAKSLGGLFQKLPCQPCVIWTCPDHGKLCLQHSPQAYKNDWHTIAQSTWKSFNCHAKHFCDTEI
jgi:hypothetical protein